MLLELSKVRLRQTDTKVNEVVGRRRLNLAPAPRRLDGFLHLVFAVLARRSVNAGGEDEPYEQSQRLHPGESEQKPREAGVKTASLGTRCIYICERGIWRISILGAHDTRHVLTAKTSFTSDIVYSFPRRHFTKPLKTDANWKRIINMSCDYNKGHVISLQVPPLVQSKAYDGATLMHSSIL